MLQQEIEGATFLDIFAGSGAIGIEALSRGAAHVTFIDSSLEAIKAIRMNLESLDVEEGITILKNDVVRALEGLSKRGLKFDLIFADAPYHNKETTGQLLEQLANLRLLKDGGRLLIEDTNSEAPLHSQFGLTSTRKAGKSYLHDFRKLF